MESKICMNEVCRATTSSEWKKGWGLKSGGFATLCQSCGSAYDNLIFCKTFHLDQSGWRECKICEKLIHCGCIASQSLHEYLDSGGIGCISCVKNMETHFTKGIQIPGEVVNNGGSASISIGNMVPIEKHLSKAIEGSHPVELIQSPKDDFGAATMQLKREKPMLPNIIKYTKSSISRKSENNKSKQRGNDNFGSLAEQPFNFSLSTPLGTSSSVLPAPYGAEGRDQNKGSGPSSGPRTQHITSKPLKFAPSTSSEPNKGMGIPPQARIARPPAEGRGRNQLLPRYWPRITDEELQQISEELNSPIVPLFEKVLSPSDAGRIGRLVLPKACAEAYFPFINQSDGIPIRVQDIKGGEWTFQFRFWPNNNSRMYVLEGVTPCIQNMQLEAGDIVTFSRMDPGEKLVIGFRKAAINDTQDSQTNIISNGGVGETTVPGANVNLASNGGRTSDDDVLRPAKKKIRNIGSKNKRLLIHSEEATMIRINTVEAQDRFQPHPATKPSIAVIEHCEIEEYELPPILGRKTIFIARQPSGEQEQWTQCDHCSKWRKLPVHVNLLPKWSCSDNVWDTRRCSCSAPEDIQERELEALLSANKDGKRRRIAIDPEPSGLDALATAAVLGDDIGETSHGLTTKHPRHRVGCTCIVCIQPPSGRGKHPPSCKCNVCSTLKRRFQTMMMRKRKRQSERVAEAEEKDQFLRPTNGSEMDMEAGEALLQMTAPEPTSNGQLDLNIHPIHEDELHVPTNTRLLNTNSSMYLKENGLGSLNPCLPSQAAGDDSEGVDSEESDSSTDSEMGIKGEDD